MGYPTRNPVLPAASADVRESFRKQKLLVSHADPPVTRCFAHVGAEETTLVATTGVSNTSKRKKSAMNIAAVKH